MVLRSWIRFLGLGFSVDGALGLWCGAFSVFFGVGAFYINVEESSWEKTLAIGMAQVMLRILFEYR